MNTQLESLKTGARKALRAAEDRPHVDPRQLATKRQASPGDQSSARAHCGVWRSLEMKSGPSRRMWHISCTTRRACSTATSRWTPGLSRNAWRGLLRGACPKVDQQAPFAAHTLPADTLRIRPVIPILACDPSKRIASPTQAFVRPAFRRYHIRAYHLHLGRVSELMILISGSTVRSCTHLPMISITYPSSKRLNK